MSNIEVETNSHINAIEEEIATKEEVYSSNFADKNDNAAQKNANFALENEDFTRGSVYFDNNQLDSGGKTDEGALSNDFSAKNVQNLPVFYDENSKKTVVSNAKSDKVYNFDSCITVQNSVQNSIFSPSEQDLAKFAQIFPGVNINNIFNDQNFKLFALKAGEKESICETYANYLDLVEKITRDAFIRAKVAESNKSVSVGPLSCSSATNNDFFTKDQVKKMSREQIARNYNAIRESQQKW